MERRAAQRQVFEQLQTPLYRLAFHLVGERAEAEDVVQQSLLELLAAVARFRGESTLSTFAHRITVRVALAARAKGRRGPAPFNWEELGRHPEELLIAKDEAERLMRAFARLSPQHQVVLSLFSMEDKSHREIADILGVPEGTVWSRLHLARKRLAAELASQGN